MRKDDFWKVPVEYTYFEVWAVTPKRGKVKAYARCADRETAEAKRAEFRKMYRNYECMTCTITGTEWVPDPNR